MVLSRGDGAAKGVCCRGRRVLSITGSDIITPSPPGQTNASENITFPQTSFASSNKHRIGVYSVQLNNS